MSSGPPTNGWTDLVLMQTLLSQTHQQPSTQRRQHNSRRTLIWTSNIAFVLTFSPSVLSTYCTGRSLLLCFTAAHCFWNTALSTQSGNSVMSLPMFLNQRMMSARLAAVQ